MLLKKIFAIVASNLFVTFVAVACAIKFKEETTKIKIPKAESTEGAKAIYNEQVLDLEDPEKGWLI